MKTAIVVISALFFLLSCNKNKVDQAEIDEDIIQSYIEKKGLNAKATGSGLHYVITKEGTGEHPSANATVKTAYKGYFTDEAVFDESDEDGLTFSLSSVIKGWQEGIPLFKEGGKGLLLVPSALGYGDKDYAGIPKNSVLIFEVKLIEVL